MEQSSVLTVERMDEMMPLIREVLASGRSARIYPMGTSMRPMLRQGVDSVVLSPIQEKLRKYDLPLYQRDDGKYVLHRIVGVGETYTCMGDNQVQKEPGLREDQMIAVVTAFYRGERKISVSHPGYWLYCRIWYHGRRARQFLKKCLGRLRRWLRQGKAK